MKTYTDTERLDILAEAIERMPDMSILFELDDCTEDEIGIIPAGWNIRVPENCAPAFALNAPTFRDLIDALIEWKDKADADALT
jgi:hypothetical protein